MTTRVLFFGTPDFAVPSLRALLSIPDTRVGAVITQPDRPTGRGGNVTAPPIKQLALENGIPVLQPRSLRKEWDELRAQLEQFGPFDIGVVVAFGQILPKSVLEYPAHGCLNVHASLLPRWRGAAPIQRALQAGDTETGVCLMRMDEGLDTGAVYSRMATPIADTDTGGLLHDRLATIGADLLRRDLGAIIAGSLQSAPQPESGVTYASKITAADTAIDWSNHSSLIAHSIRAFSPYPGCFTTLAGKRFKLVTARAVELNNPHSATPGTVIHAQDGRCVIACGTGALMLEEVHLEGKRRMQIDEFLRGTSIHPGEQLGR